MTGAGRGAPATLTTMKLASLVSTLGLATLVALGVSSSPAQACSCFIRAPFSTLPFDGERNVPRDTVIWITANVLDEHEQLFALHDQETWVDGEPPEVTLESFEVGEVALEGEVRDPEIFAEVTLGLFRTEAPLRPFTAYNIRVADVVVTTFTTGEDLAEPPAVPVLSPGEGFASPDNLAGGLFSDSCGPVFVRTVTASTNTSVVLPAVGGVRPDLPTFDDLPDVAMQLTSPTFNVGRSFGRQRGPNRSKAIIRAATSSR